MKNLYTTKQVFGGLLLVILFIMVFAINILKKEYNMFLTPILVGITLCLLGYILVLHEIIQTKKDLLLKKDKYNFKTCPDEYKQNVNFFGNDKEIECINSNKVIPAFYLQSNENKCANKEDCFNKIQSREEKCNNIQAFFKTDTVSNGNTLNNWSEYQNQCII
jgi:hypothetical protein